MRRREASDVPSLAVLCERHVLGVLSSISTAMANCKEQTRTLDERKTSLLVELAQVSASLEEVHRCRLDLEDMRDGMLEDIEERLGAESAQA